MALPLTNSVFTDFWVAFICFSIDVFVLVCTRYEIAFIAITFYYCATVVTGIIVYGAMFLGCVNHCQLFVFVF